MKKLIFTFFFLITICSFSQEELMSNYELAAKFSPTKLSKLVHSTSVNPHWLKRGDKFWYQYKTTNGSKYYMVDPNKRTKKELFNNEKMAAWLTEKTKDPYDGKHLPKFNFKFIENETAIEFRVNSKYEEEEEKDSLEKDKKNKKVFHFKYVLGSNNLSLISNDRKPKENWKKWANISPDSTIVFFSRKFNLYWMDKANFLKAVKNEKDSTIVENQWTKDGLNTTDMVVMVEGLIMRKLRKRKMIDSQ